MSPAVVVMTSSGSVKNERSSLTALSRRRLDVVVAAAVVDGDWPIHQIRVWN